MKNEDLNVSLHKSYILNINSREEGIKWPNESSSVSSGLISQLKNINNSSEQLSHGVKKTSTERLIHLWSSLWPFSNGQSASLNEEEEGAPLTEILAEGKFINQQAESLQDSKNKQVSCYGWKGGYLKRCLVGVGLLTGAGVVGELGFGYYAGRNGYNESKNNFILPNLTGPHQNHFTSFHNCQMDFDRVALPSDLFITKNCEYNSEMDFINKVVTQPLDFVSEFNASTREKRSITIKNDYIPNLILSILQDSTFDWRVTNEFDLIFRHADASPDVRNAKSSEEKNIKLLLKTIQITQQCIDNNKYGHVKYKAFESFSDILKKLWNIANNLPDAYGKQTVKKFKEIYSYMSTTIEPHNSSDASHGTTVPTPIAKPRIIDNTVGNDTSVGVGVGAVGGDNYRCRIGWLY